MSRTVELFLDCAGSSRPAPGKLRALAVTTAARSAAMPDIPTVAGSVPGFEASARYGIGPRNTPAEITNILNREITASL